MRLKASTAVSSASGRVKVLLRGHDRRVAKPLFHDLKVGAAGEQLRGMSLAKIMHVWAESELGGLAGR